MKKNIIVVILVLLLTISVLAGSYQDVPNNHWAYEAVDALAATGLITGYPDATYQGENQLTRYEIAVILARLLNQIDEKSDKIFNEAVSTIDETVEDIVKESTIELSESQEIQVENIIESIIEKNQAIPKELSKEQLIQVIDLIDALSYEFKSELSSLNVDNERILGEIKSIRDKYKAFDGFNERLVSLESKVYNPTVTLSGSYQVDIRNIVSDSVPGAIPYADPFKLDYTENQRTLVQRNGNVPNDIYGRRDYFQAGSFNHQDRSNATLNLNIDVDKAPFSANIQLAALTHEFESTFENDLDLRNFRASIEGGSILIDIEPNIRPDFAPYLFHSTQQLHGAVARVGRDNSFALGNIKNGPQDKDLVFAGLSTVSLLEQKFDIAYGISEEYGNQVYLEDKPFILGASTSFNLAGFNITPDFAVSDLREDDKFNDTYFTLNARGFVGPAAVQFNYENIKDTFTPMGDRGHINESNGFDFMAVMTVLNRRINLELSYENYENNEPLTNLYAQIREGNAYNLADINIFGDFKYDIYNDVDHASKTEFNVYAKRPINNFDLTASLNYYSDTDPYIITKNDEEYRTFDYFNKSIKADYIFNQNLQLGTEAILYEENDSHKAETFVYGNYVPDPFTIFNIELSPYGEAKYAFVANTYKLITGVDASIALNRDATLTGKYEYGVISENAFYNHTNPYVTIFGEHQGMAGEKQTKEVNLEYRITNNISFNLSYVNFYFDNSRKDVDDDIDFRNDLVGGVFEDGITDESYDFQAFIAGLNITF